MDESSRRPVQVDGDGAAKRRRLRRLRSWRRHEQQTVAAVLASAHHHSNDRKGKTKVVAHEGSEEVEYVPLDATSAGAAGASCGGCRAGGVDRGTLPGRRWGDPDPCRSWLQGESVDSSALSFLLSQSLMAEQEAKEAKELEANLAAREQQLLEEVEEARTSPTRGARGSPVEVAAAW